MDSQLVSEIFDSVICIASIDGQTSSSSRHAQPKLIVLFNRHMISLRSLVSKAGHTYFQDETASAALPGQTTGEEYQLVDYPDGAYEIMGVDVQHGARWNTLDQISWASRRDVVRYQATFGQWAVKKLPRENGASAFTAGKIAIFPPTLTGNYKIWYIVPWIPIALADIATHPVILYPDWSEWLIQSMVMDVIQRDNNKKDNYQIAKSKRDEAADRIKASARMIQRSGPRIPRRIDGIEL